MLKVISILVEDKPGVLMRIAGLFFRRGFNIDALSVGSTEIPGKSRFTITVNGDEAVLEQVRKQVQKLVNVHRTAEHDSTNSQLREYALIKIEFTEKTKTEIFHLVDFFGGRIIDIFEGAAIVEIADEKPRIDTLFERLAPYGIIESLRTGQVSMFRGKRSINAQPRVVTLTVKNRGKT
jgi:acetolactate synthase-1/3 small subunit